MSLWKVGTWRLGTWRPGVWLEELDGLPTEVGVTISVGQVVAETMGAKVITLSTAVPEIGVRKRVDGVRSVLSGGGIDTIVSAPSLLANHIAVSSVSVIVESENG